MISNFMWGFFFVAGLIIFIKVINPKADALKDGYATLQLSESIYSSGFPRAHIRSDGTGFFYYSNNKTQNCKTNLTWTKRGNNAEINIGTNPNCPGVASKFNGSYPIR